jgi:nitrogen fixation NifU-like protein
MLGNDLYREQLLDHYRNPHGWGLKEGSTVQQVGYNPLCGDRVTVQVDTDGASIQAMRFEGQGCVISQAAASLLSEHVVEKDIAEVQKIGLEDIQNLLGVELPPVRIKCGLLALESLQLALKRKT